MKVAAAHHPLSADIRSNGKTIHALMDQAASAGAQLLHLPEGALSGYVKSEIPGWDGFDWPALHSQIADIQDHARRLGLWIVMGSCHQMPGGLPRNSLLVISNRGDLTARYDKRILSYSENQGWYSAGDVPVIFDIDGRRFGCALCIEIHFAELFIEYRNRNVDCILLSSYSNDSIFETTARAHASMNSIWLSHATCANPTPPLASVIVGPDGHIQARSNPAGASLAIAEINPDDPRWDIPLRKAKPWRNSIRRSLPPDL